MEPELFLLEMAETEECKSITYKRLAIREFMGLYFSQKRKIGQIDPFMIPFGEVIKNSIKEYEVNIDDLVKYMIDNDKSNCALFAATAWFKPKAKLSSGAYYSAIAKYKIITPFVEEVDLDAVALMVVCFVFDNLTPTKIDISEFVKGEVFAYPTNQYGLTKVNGAVFKLDGLIFNGKGYYYNILTNKAPVNSIDTMVGFARIIHDETKKCDILYRLDERLSVPESEYYDYTGAAFAKFRGPQFNFDRSNLNGKKTITVHIDEETMDKLLMVVKQGIDQNTGEEFWHIEIETLPYRDSTNGYVITTFLHGMYYPHKDVFTHIDYTKNQYSGNVYSQKYADSQNGIPIDQYTETRDLHYKIWCIENGEFTRETWYKLMIISLSESYQRLLNEILA